MFHRRMRRHHWDEGREEGERHERHEQRGQRERGERQRHEGRRFDPRGTFPDWFAPHEHHGRGPHGPRGPFGGDGPFGDGPFGRGRRQRRGDIKLALLELLAEQPRHGYDLIRELEQRSGGFYRPSPGSVYPTLQLLEDEGNVTSETVEGKRVYTITDAGHAFLAENRDPRVEHLRRGLRMGQENQDLGELRQSVAALGVSVMQLARTGTPAQVKEAMAILDRTRREIYAILAREGDQDAGE